MDYNALWAEIQANEACAPHIHTNDMQPISGAEVRAKDEAIAAIINTNRVAIIYREIGEGSISEAMGVPAGPLFMRNLKAAAETPLPEGATADQIAWKAITEQALRLIDKASLNIGSAKVRAGIDAFVAAGLLSAEGAAAVKQLAEVPAPVTVADVSRAVRGPRGG